jgi:hypothetical protein
MNRSKPDADTLAVWRTLKLAAKDARKLAKQKGTPFYVWQNGKLKNLNPNATRRRAAINNV